MYITVFYELQKLDVSDSTPDEIWLNIGKRNGYNLIYYIPVLKHNLLFTAVVYRSSRSKQTKAVRQCQ